MNWISIGALWGLLGVGMGAFGAHGLEDVATEEGLAWWTTGAEYQLYHAPALMVAGILARQSALAGKAALVMWLGSLVFSGTLYAMALGASTKLGMVTPIGGLLLMIGWLLLALAARGQAR